MAAIPLKLFLHKLERRVVYAESDHDFVDVLLSFLTLPIGCIFRLIREDSHPLNNLRRSITTLDECNFASEDTRNNLLNSISTADQILPSILYDEDIINEEYLQRHGAFVRKGLNYIITDDLCIDIVTVTGTFRLVANPHPEEKNKPVTISEHGFEEKRVTVTRQEVGAFFFYLNFSLHRAMPRLF